MEALRQSTNQALKQCGFHRSLDEIDQLYKLAGHMVSRAGSGQVQAFETLVSYIPSRAANFNGQPQLIIDVGGTSTKVGLRVGANGNSSDWILLFEDDNNDIRDATVKSSGLASFATCLAKKAANTALHGHQVTIESIQSCAIVWSNSFMSQPCTESTGEGQTGITGIVLQRELYKKGEWFNRDLKNGTDLGKIFSAAFANAGIHINKLLVGNDTPLTMKAANGAHGGMVASTGLNGTLVKDLEVAGVEQSVICNAEMGGRFYLPGVFLSDFDVGSDIKGDITIEALVAGGFLPRVFVNHINGLTPQLAELNKLAHYLSSLPDAGYSFFRSEDLAGFITNPGELAIVKGQTGMFSEKVLTILSCLAENIFIRAARLAAVVAYATVQNQLTSNKEFIVALDSSLCRTIPTFNLHFNQQLKESYTGYDNCQIKAHLLQPLATTTGRISVPMQGAANALDCLP